MKKAKTLKSFLSVFLAVLMIISAVPISLAIQNAEKDHEASPIIRELSEKREASSKQFLCEDGSIAVAVYPEPVHYNDSGVWKEIDNSLKLSGSKLSASGKPTYTNKANDIDVGIPQSFADSQQIAINKEGYELKFGLNNEQENISLDSTAVVVDVKDLPSSRISASEEKETESPEIDSVEESNKAVMEVETKSGAVVYKNIFPDTDIEYILSGSSMKENVVINKPQEKYTYEFDVDFGDLIPVFKDNGFILFVEPDKQDEPVYYIPTPYMYDAEQNESIDITISIESTENGSKLVLEADAEWINSEERTFPVVIDPTFNFANSAFHDVFVMDGVFANSTRVGNELRVGKNLTNLTRTYIKMDMPTNIAYGAKVTSASIDLKKASFFQAAFQNDITITAYDCVDSDPWDISSVTWNNQPNAQFDHPHTLSTISASDDVSTYSFNVFLAVRRWLEYGQNDGLAFKSNRENSKTQVDLHSSRVNTASNRPVMYFTYNEPGIATTIWNIDSNAKISPAISVTAAPDYEVRCSESWLSPTQKGSSSFKLHATRNDSAYTRTATATIVLWRPGFVNYVIGVVTVTQLGTDSSMLVDTENWAVASDGGTKTVSVTSNADWTVSSDSPSWLSVAQNSTSFQISATSNVASGNNVSNVRTGTITVQTTGLQNNIIKTINVIQYDEITEFFGSINSDGTITQRNSSDYNHALATWAMDLSYSAYNPLLPEFPQNITGMFMNGRTSTTKDILENYGFDEADIQEYNYGINDSVAHVIAHKEICYSNNAVNCMEGDINYGNSIELLDPFQDTFPSTYTDCGLSDTICLSDNISVRSNSGSSCYENTESDTGECRVLETNYRAYSELSPQTDGMVIHRPLITVVIRGSTTMSDWLMDINTQFSTSLYTEFSDGRNMVLDSLYGTNDTANCAECNGEGCLKCIGYIDYYGIENPIILVTGHSLGAAVANLVATDLDTCNSQDHGACGNSADVFAYTFATPKSYSGRIDDPDTYDNIFNILNTNDVVTYVPLDIYEGSSWTRYGRDFYFTMPMCVDTTVLSHFDRAWLGVGGHAMPNYLSWLQNLPANLNCSADEITADVLSQISESNVAVGLLPKLLRVKCPVSVSIYDESGNLLAFETQDQNTPQPTTINSDIISWIGDDGAKMFYIPYGFEDIDARIEAYDYGTMDLTIETPGAGEPVATKTYNDVVLYPGKEFDMEISSETDIEDTALYLVENGVVTNIEPETDPLFKSISSNNYDPVDGARVEYTIVTDSSVTEIHLFDGENLAPVLIIYPTEDCLDSVVIDGDNKIWTVSFNISHDIYYDDESGEPDIHVYSLVLFVPNEIPTEYNNVMAVTVH